MRLGLQATGFLRRPAPGAAYYEELRSIRANSASVTPTRPAAVTIAIFGEPPYRVVFVERAAHLRDHPGQIGLPGGAADPEDGEDRARTALRELREEVGIPADRIQLVGELPEVRQRVNNFVVRPFVGVIVPGTKLAFDENETAAVFTIPLAEIVSPGAIRLGMERIGERVVETYVLYYGDRHIWGLTARMLRSFADRWHDPADPLRVHIESALEAA
ncbi:MAG: CoA pyrophosphatase [Candidatus Velthaea sp.]